jgi:thioredoxin reductase (NADPH)
MWDFCELTLRNPVSWSFVALQTEEPDHVRESRRAVVRSLAMETLRTNVAIVGAGPIGLELAVALKQRGIDYAHFEARQIGYTVSWFAPQARFFSSNERIAIAGVPLQTPDQGKASRETYLAYLRSVVEQFDLEVHTYHRVTGIHHHDDGNFLLTMQHGRKRTRCLCRRLVLCTGGTDRPRKLGIPGEDLPHVSYYLKDPHDFFQSRLMIVGGKNSAVESALRCYQAGARVAVSYRGAQFEPKSIKYWLLPEINGLVQEGKIAGYFQTTPLEITPEHVRLKQGDSTIDVPAEFVLMQIGYEQDTTLFELAGIELSGGCKAPAFDPVTMETNVPGLYVAGTAVGGTQDKYRVFIENCHVHVGRIISALVGAAPPPAPKPLASPES